MKCCKNILFNILTLIFIQGFTMVRNYYDTLRMDTDHMSYEELLALGERIGNVSTGLSECKMSNCLKEKTYRLSKKNHDESRCAICLEEYKSKEVIAKLVNCGHDYHTKCIRKWLSMKKVCPICKDTVLKDG